MRRRRSFPAGFAVAFSSSRPPVSLGSLLALRQAALLVEDRRLFEPVIGVRPVRGLSHQASRVVASNSVPGFSPALSFFAPKKVALCVRRHVRREVLAAKGKFGGGHRRPRRNFWSDVEC